MKYGIITDIHNNVIALRAVLKRLDEMNCDGIICCGDIIGIGPSPEETVQEMARIPGLISVRGNHEVYLLEGMPEGFPNEENMSLGEMEHHKWEHGLLSEGSVAFLRGMPYRIDLETEGLRITVMHSCMDGNGRFSGSKRNPSESDLMEMFADIDSDIILYGHDHMRNICRSDKLYINVGSLGCPSSDRNTARAGVLTIENGNAEIETIDVIYDVKEVIHRIDTIDYPDADLIKKCFFGLEEPRRINNCNDKKDITAEELKSIWKTEEDCTHIKGWDFSHINGRYEEEELPWDYGTIIRGFLRDEMKLLDYDTGGGEFLLSLGHPYENTAATEGYPPNVELCRERLIPLGIDIRECSDAAHIPFSDGSFDIIINRHGSFCPKEIARLLKPGGLFITQQVGSENDRDLVETVLPGTERPFPHESLKEQKAKFIEAGFEILREDEAYVPIRFYDVGAFVWFARIIEWEFPGFSVDRCFDRLLNMQKIVERDGRIVGTTHRYLIAARKSL